MEWYAIEYEAGPIATVNGSFLFLHKSMKIMRTFQESLFFFHGLWYKIDCVNMLNSYVKTVKSRKTIGKFVFCRNGGICVQGKF